MSLTQFTMKSKKKKLLDGENMRIVF